MWCKRIIVEFFVIFLDFLVFWLLGEVKRLCMVELFWLSSRFFCDFFELLIWVRYWCWLSLLKGIYVYFFVVGYCLLKRFGFVWFWFWLELMKNWLFDVVIFEGLWLYYLFYVVCMYIEYLVCYCKSFYLLGWCKILVMLLDNDFFYRFWELKWWWVLGLFFYWMIFYIGIVFEYLIWLMVC